MIVILAIAKGSGVRLLTRTSRFFVRGTPRLALTTLPVFNALN